MLVESLVSKRFKVFNKQIDMFNFKKDLGPEFHCFAFQEDFFTSGQRKFFAANVMEFSKFYSCLSPDMRLFYEIIEESKPCRLYFDIEYYFKLNSIIDGKAMLLKLIDIVCEMLKYEYALTVSSNAFIILDSTTSEKFSFHLICHLPDKHLFKNNQMLKNFICKLKERLKNEKMCVINTDNSSALIFDPSVYSRNRNFRLYLSSKCGKKTPLKLSELCTFYETQPNHQQVLFDTMVIPNDYNLSLIIPEIDDVNCKISKSVLIPKMLKKGMVTIDSGTGSSFFKDLDLYLVNINSNVCRNVCIKSWVLFEAYNEHFLQFYLNGCRFCHNISREHKSNNVYWIYNFKQGVFYQKCFDDKCIGFKSNPFTVADVVLHRSRKYLAHLLNSKQKPGISYHNISVPFERKKQGVSAKEFL